MDSYESRGWNEMKRKNPSSLLVCKTCVVAWVSVFQPLVLLSQSPKMRSLFKRF